MDKPITVEQYGKILGWKIAKSFLDADVDREINPLTKAKLYEAHCQDAFHHLLEAKKNVNEIDFQNGIFIRIRGQQVELLKMKGGKSSLIKKFNIGAVPIKFRTFQLIRVSNL